MILSVVAYTSMAIVFFALGRHASVRDNLLRATSGQGIPFYAWETTLIVIIFATIAGARMGTGYDHAMYLHQYYLYQKYGFFTRDFEPLFTWVTQLMADSHIHFFFYFFLWGVLQMFFLTYACRHRKELLPWMCLNVMLGPFWLYLMNTMREGVVASIFLSMMPLIANRKFLAYSLIAFVAAGIHKAAILMIPFYYIGLIDLKPSVKTRNLMMLVLLIAILLGIRPFWLSWTMLILNKLGFVSEQYQHIVVPVIQGNYNFANWGPMRLSILGLDVMATWLYPKIRGRFSDDNILPCVYAFFLAGCFISYSCVNVHHLFLRPFDFFMISKVLVYAYTALFLFSCRKWLLLSLFCAMNYSCVYIMIAKAVMQPVKVNTQILLQFFFARVQ